MPRKRKVKPPDRPRLWVSPSEAVYRRVLNVAAYLGMVKGRPLSANQVLQSALREYLPKIEEEMGEWNRDKVEVIAARREQARVRSKRKGLIRWDEAKPGGGK